MVSADQAQALRGLVEEHERRQRQSAWRTGQLNEAARDRYGHPSTTDTSAQSTAHSQASAADVTPNDNTAPRLTRAVAITSGKGGVGKTTVAVNLAVQLARMDQRVVLLDADLGTANVDVMCNRMPSNRLAQVIEGRASLDEVIVDAPGGFRLIPGGSGLAQVANLNDDQRRRLVRQMQGLEAESDIMLIDTSAGVGQNVLGFTLAADQVLVVTSPEPTAITDAYAVIKMICRQTEHPDIRLVINMACDEAEGRAVYDRIAAVCRRFLNLTPAYGGYVQNDPGVITAIRQRKPFTLEHPRSPASKNLAQLARGLYPEPPTQPDAHPTGHGVLSRLAARFARRGVAMW